MVLSHEDWEKINATAVQLWLPVSEEILRKKILESIRKIIPFSLGGFSYYIDTGDGRGPRIDDHLMVGDYSNEFLKDHGDLYDNVYGKYDYTRWLLGSKESIVCRESDIISEAAREKTIFYNDYLKPRNLLYCLDCYIVKDNIKPMILYFYRDDMLGDFSDRDVYILNQLMPHIEGRFVLNAMHDAPHKKEDAFSIYLKTTYGLTWREIQVAKLVKEGHTNKEIGAALSIEVSTVKKHITSILGKTEMAGRLKLMKLLSAFEQSI